MKDIYKNFKSVFPTSSLKLFQHKMFSKKQLILTLSFVVHALGNCCHSLIRCFVSCLDRTERHGNQLSLGQGHFTKEQQCTQSLSWGLKWWLYMEPSCSRLQCQPACLMEVNHTLCQRTFWFPPLSVVWHGAMGEPQWSLRKPGTASGISSQRATVCSTALGTVPDTLAKDGGSLSTLDLGGLPWWQILFTRNSSSRGLVLKTKVSVYFAWCQLLSMICPLLVLGLQAQRQPCSEGSHRCFEMCHIAHRWGVNFLCFGRPWKVLPNGSLQT